MQLDKIEAVVRPRIPWEAIDLGFCMVQRWAWDFYRIWFALTLPLFIVIYGLAALFTETPTFWAPVITWWLKPLYDRIVLHFFSYALFGEQMTLRKMLNALPRLLLNTHLLLGLTLYRLSPIRSFTLPIWQLEGSRGNVAAQRKKVLQQNTSNHAVWLTVVCLHFQALIVILLYLLIFLLIPENIDVDELYFFFAENDGLFLWVDLVLNYIALSLIEPFYVAGGFALYLNRRTHLEGWDIELTFRQIRQKADRLHTSISVCLAMILVAMLSVYSTETLAQTVAEPKQAKPYIEEILQQPEFDTHKKYEHWKYIEDKVAIDDRPFSRSEGRVLIRSNSEQTNSHPGSSWQQSEFNTYQHTGNNVISTENADGTYWSLWAKKIIQVVADPEQTESYIEEILQQSEFETYKEQQFWKYTGDRTVTKDDTEGWQLSFSWVAFWARLFEMLLWIGLVAAIAWVIYKILQHPVIQQWLNQRQTEHYQPQAETTWIPEDNQPLPNDIAQQAWMLWEQGEHRQAISLLYRGTLTQLQQQYEVAIYDSATENECIRLVSRTQSNDLTAYFSRLTHAWQVLAYGKYLPDEQEVQQLCEQWPQFFS
ncbi:DUF4129 domain-containing protein [Candidatus Albibeggiatoa sp. nov. NOAA]|uniref:DUF4129 domain-containing protein n=1 Tax=Candidatus Albibeggiatoa sp. nov. NOAA TaxID=3162724 RepID=UPI00330411F0|nr:DUF4129 domain-containing protein [Thiotrichaceae bacterium]